MGKLYRGLENQLKNEDYRIDAENCIKIYNKLKELNNGSVWDSEIEILLDIKFIGNYPNTKRIYKLSKIGYVFLKGIID